MDRSVHQIKSRTAALGLKNVDIIDLLRERGIKTSQQQYSEAVNRRSTTPKAYEITSAANEILAEMEKGSR